MDVKISTITMSCRFPDCALNLTNIGKYLDIDDSIIGIKYKFAELNLTKGKYCTTIYKKSKIKDETKINKTLFYNQITLIVNNNGNHVNVKLFGNGSLHLTGCKTIHEGCDVAKILYSKLETLRTKTDTVFLTKDVNNVLLDKDKLIYSYDTQQIIGFYRDACYFINKKEYIIDQKTELLVSKKLETGRQRSIVNMNGKIIGNVKIELLKNKTKFYKRNDNIYYDHENGLIHYNNELILGKFVYDYDKSQCTNTSSSQDAFEITYSCNPYINNNYCIDTNLPVETLQDVLDVDVNCINVYFNINFKINRIRLYEQLVHQGYICKYKPESYSGIKLIYKIPLNFDEINENTSYHVSGLCRCTSKCTCRNITFLIFQSGNIIATGFKNDSQIQTITQTFMDMMLTLRSFVSIKHFAT